jgi:chromosome segregation ATPase
MTERLDRIEAILERTATQQERHADEIDTLLGAVSTTGVAVNNLVAEMAKTNAAVAESHQRFDVLRDEAIADRRENRELWNDAMTQVERDRAEYREKFDRAMAQSDTDWARADERHAAQMEVIQTLLLELTKSNGNINTLRDRVDNLERAS